MLRGLGIALSIALIGMGLLCYSTPWQQVDSNDGGIYQTLGYAPVWSHEFSGIPGAQVDSDQFALYAIVILVVAVVAGLCAYIIYGPPWWRRAGIRH
jgi:ABC-type multidrug transport system permease subunit